MAEEEGDLSMTAAPTLRVAVQKPKFGIYYALLIIALCGMLISCGVLLRFIYQFEDKFGKKNLLSANARPTVMICYRDHGEVGVLS